MILQIAVTGNARINPDSPHSFPKSNSENTATSGLMLTFDPTTYGVITFPSRIWTNRNTPSTPPAYQYESFVTNATITGRAAPIRMPIYGMITSIPPRNPKNNGDSMPNAQSPTEFRVPMIAITFNR